MNLSEIKNVIENNRVSVATVMADGKPNLIIIDGVKVVSDTEIIITDNYMNQTPKDILNNRDVCVLVWNEDIIGYKMIGQAEYFTAGKWSEYVKSLANNAAHPAKGAILVTVEKIIPSV